MVPCLIAMNQFSFDEPQKLTVLIGEDDLDAILLLPSRTRLHRLRAHVKIVRDGQEALDYLGAKASTRTGRRFRFLMSC